MRRHRRKDGNGFPACNFPGHDLIGAKQQVSRLPGLKTLGTEDLAQESHDRLAYGTAALVAEILIAMVIATFVKFVTDDVSVAVLLLFRYVFCLPVLLGLGCLESGARLFRLANRRALALRTLFGLAGLTCWIVAIANIELTKATAVSQTLPVFITFFAPFLLGERVGLRRWVAVLIGLSGTLIILRPDQEGWLQTGTAAAIAAPFFAALMFIYLRKLGQSDAPSTTAIYYNFAGTCVFSAWCLAMPVSWPQSASALVNLLPPSSRCWSDAAFWQEFSSF